MSSKWGGKKGDFPPLGLEEQAYNCVPGELSQNCLEREDGTSLGVRALVKQSQGPRSIPLHFC